jgi:hypothetical protein
METTATRQKTITVHCKQCAHQWEAFMNLPIPVARAMKVMKGIVAAGCPECGAHGNNVLVGPTPPPT